MSKAKKKNIKQKKASAQRSARSLKKGSKDDTFKVFQSDQLFRTLILFFSVIAFLYFTLHHLGKFATTDEYLWLFKRYFAFWDTIILGKTDYPIDQFSRSSLVQCWLSFRNYLYLDETNLNHLNFENYLWHWRLPLVLMNTILILIGHQIAKRLFHPDKALLLTIFIATFPFIIGITQIFNKDTTLWSTSYCAFLSFLLLLKTNKWRDVLLTGTFLGLAVASKFSATFFYIIFFILLYCEYLFKGSDRTTFIQKSIKLFLICIISIIILFLLNPFAWDDPFQIVNWTLGNSIFKSAKFLFLAFLVIIYSEIFIFKGLVSNYLRNQLDVQYLINKIIGGLLLCLFLFIFSTVLLDNFSSYKILEIAQITDKSLAIQKFLPSFFSGFRTLFTAAPTLLMVSVLGLLISIFTPKLKIIKFSIPSSITYCLIIILLYYLGGAISGVHIQVRYQVILMPIYALLGAHFVFQFIAKRPSYKKLIISALLVLSFFEVKRVAPFYLEYKNLFSIHSILQPTGVSWGQGGYEMAQWVNELPNLNQINVLSDYAGFNRFYAGRGRKIRNKDLNTKRGLRKKDTLKWSNLQEFDYLCLSSSGESFISRRGTLTKALRKYYDEPLDQAEAYIGNKDRYVKIVKVRKK